MLCDQIVSWPGLVSLSGPIGETYAAIGQALARTHRFVLNRDAVLTVHSIAESSPKRFLQALSLCRLPHRRIWVEFAYQDRADWMADAATRGLVVDNHEDAGPPARLGFYMEQQDEDGRVITVVPCWSHRKLESGLDIDTVSICGMALTIRTDDGADAPDPEHRRLARETIAAKSHNKQSLFARWMNDPAEIEAAFVLDARMAESVPPVLAGLWAHLKDAPLAEVERCRNMARFDLKSEWRFVLSLLTVLNSRNVIEVAPGPDLSRLNKARARKGAPPLLDHREIRLSPSRVQGRRLAGAARSRDLQSHIVQGHWKLRRSGLFWWNPFVRGSVGEPCVTTTTVRG